MLSQAAIRLVCIPNQHISYNEDGSIVLSLTVNHLLELKRWVLSWGKEARVLEPGRLAQDIQSEVGGMLEVYDSGITSSSSGSGGTPH